jgi:hypothetical protein
MANYTKWDIFFATLSWIIALSLLFSMIMLWVTPPSGLGPVAKLIGILGAQIFYSGLYGTEALVLAYSKLFRKKELRKKALMAIYLTALFTGILTFILGAPFSGFIDNAILILITGACWLWWKFKTEYIHPALYRSDVVEHRTRDL